eukprot:maker-scaffold_35-snap-gene-1.57-mRNA-1 protein AED:0.24 eAED:0.24 QI:44/1/1/1/0.5/0.33/3/19/607
MNGSSKIKLNSNENHVRLTSPISTRKETKFLFVTGGVVSGLGKGITISSIGVLLRAKGIETTCIKIDPYLNTDAGTMSPFEHGETFVLDDGGETDLDLGNYERFMDINLTKEHNITTGKVYKSVIDKERNGDYLGKTVQVVPHVTDEIQKKISKVSQIPVSKTQKRPEVCLVEIGGTVGDIESVVFLESIRQFILRVGRDRCCLVHVSLVPSMGEQKTKPTQHGIKALMSCGLTADFIACRSTSRLEEQVVKKISAFCNVHPSNVISVHDCENIYQVPLILKEQNIDELIITRLGVKVNTIVENGLDFWTAIAAPPKSSGKVSIALVGKYTRLTDSYLSVNKALKHACLKLNLTLDLVFLDSDEFNLKELDSVDGVVIPGGFGPRGIEGMIRAIKYCREKQKPILGICLGMQCMVIEAARSNGLHGANSAEFDQEAKDKVIIEMLEHHTGVMGGTMRLGARTTLLSDVVGKKSLAKALYSKYLGKEVNEVVERHRHRYEVNPKYVKQLEETGLSFVGKDESGERMEIVEMQTSAHPFLFGTQYHPEFLSRPGKPSPPFMGLILAASEQLGDVIGNGEAGFLSPKNGAKRKRSPSATEFTQTVKLHKS